MKSETELLVDSLNEAGVPVTETEVVITVRERTPANAEKIAILKDLLDVIDEEEVDKFFLAIIDTAVAVGLNFKADPVVLLQTIERKHQAKTPPVYPRSTFA